ncbi:FAD-binding oxidoreductase [Methylobacterium soli]|uniref:FAD-binding oxidoreductase n=1 Tax=Methylobacterium soli TaxID=553447 RepID=A0A6L3SZC4_9HYPH|nr:FAD-binding oxidoreductase [Methylobacterium soli]KAB1077517.1 FAD-binding oxidoreductase [Methylobacterium soli]GJE44993.1 putative FAD-linked oxidoreductase [Methylobacterium soli]
MPDDILEPFRALLGEGGVLTAPDMLARYTLDHRALMQGETPAVLRPRAVEEVQGLVRLARRHGFGLVPQGGNTGYVGGATPEPGRRQLVVSLERMARIRAIDPLNFTLACDAGAVLADAQAAAAAHDLLLPLSLGSEGSCRLGGNLGTNAGGLQVLRYGMTRDLVLGLEVVLPDASLFTDMRSLRKNNIGIDPKQLFIGAEGTLGIITGVVLKLWPAQSFRATAWLQLAEGAPLPEISALVRRESADLATTFELISASSLGLVAEMRGTPIGLRTGPGGAVLLELQASSARIPLDDVLMGTLERLMEQGWVEDAILAQSEAQRREMWTIRETIPEGEKHAGGSFKHDIAVPVSRLTDFLGQAGRLLAERMPDVRLSFYGHVGDGNIHYNLVVPKGEDRLAFSRAVEAGIAHDLYALAIGLGGSFSAEYGIGRFKRDLLARYTDPARRALMATLKRGIDPDGVMNAGAMLEDGAA